MDIRDELAWVAIELAKSGENKVIEGTLERRLRRDLGVGDEHPIFIPVALFRRNDKVTPVHLMEGYAFVASGLDEVAYFALEQQPYVNAVMSTQSGEFALRTLSVIGNAQVMAMREKLRDLVGSQIPLDVNVDILEGPYRGLSGMILGLDDDNAFVRITMRSLDVVATIPRIFLEEQVD